MRDRHTPPLAVPPLTIDGDRLWSSLMAMARIGPGVAGGCNRQALTDADREGRDLFVSWAREAGCRVSIDQMGNIFARRPGRDDEAAPVLAGSHLDTQPTGGRFDGVYGVLAGLEVVRSLNDRGIQTLRPIEVACWTNEEGARFAPAMLGSGVVSGTYDLEFAYARQDKSGRSFKDELARIGYLGDTPAAPREFAAMFEAHIEQGPILEHEGNTIGVVTGIQGAYWFDVTLDGQSCHAGPTPMALRRDPWRAAAPIIAEGFAIAERNGPDGRFTIGDMKAEPGSRNTVPHRVTFPIDMRHPDMARLDAMVAAFRGFAEARSSDHRIGFAMEQVWRMPATAFDARLIDLIEESAEQLGYRHRRIVSGAGHDSLHTAQFAPTAMIFVPCAGGLSHNEAEDATPADLAAGASVLLHAMLKAADA
ncbi:MAG: amidase, hydantoinase/carbamoylase family [Caulobacteraceae bacterium]|nr:amidase, hydantoinase/carbamoylase family [Caulobacteraceae bacterium]